ncbi:membrane protease subunit HflC [Thermotomaculum hydrothermale]|uniref:Protein HflC n=1 Tax=Thermotomaculum hydrothermale TaxID=981385 RepID=A0A7R6SYB4_9BACT|nr:protease modulator HflC [Thermotomaculum hydrothermale]BBB32594.1 membrane protease subunit HflC [Thermotomaculum hydrothermale]
MKSAVVIIVLAILGLFLLSSSAFIVKETEQVVITQFGKPVGKPITESGLHFKIPFIQKANFFEKRWLEWDGDANQVTTKDKKYIWIDTYARWRIKDPLKFFETVGNEMGAQSRLDDILDGETRIAIAKYNLIEVVRTTNRPMEMAATYSGELSDNSEFTVKVGREKITRQILEKISKITPSYGIEVVDVRIKRVNYVESVRKKVYQRMISERKRIAEQYRSEGMGKKAEIIGKTQRELEKIRSEAYKKAQEIKGKADAEATKIYAQAYSKDPNFYKFLKTLETLEKTVKKDDVLILSTDSDVYNLMKRAK